jgi:hypothetical protein
MDTLYICEKETESALRYEVARHTGIDVRTLESKADYAFKMHSLGTLDIVLDEKEISLRALRWVASNENYAPYIHEIVIHAVAASVRGKWNLALPETIAELSGQIDRLHRLLRTILPMLPNCRMVSLIHGLHIDPIDGYCHFLGVRTLEDTLYDEYGPGESLTARDLPHKLATHLNLQVASAIAGSKNQVEMFDIGLDTPLQDLRYAFYNTPCRTYRDSELKELVLELVEIDDDDFNSHYVNIHLGDPGTWAANEQLPALPKGQREHECQQMNTNLLNPWEAKSRRHASVQSMLRHYPNLKKLRYYLGMWITNSGQAPHGLDCVPSYFPETLKELTLSCWIGNVADLSASLMRLKSLQQLGFELAHFQSLDAFRKVMSTCARHPSLSTVPLQAVFTGLHGEPMMICTGSGDDAYCRRLHQDEMSHEVITPFPDMPHTLRSWCNDDTSSRRV